MQALLRPAVKMDGCSADDSVALNRSKDSDCGSDVEMDSVERLARRLRREGLDPSILDSSDEEGGRRTRSSSKQVQEGEGEASGEQPDRPVLPEQSEQPERPELPEQPEHPEGQVQLERPNARDEQQDGGYNGGMPPPPPPPLPPAWHLKYQSVNKVAMKCFEAKAPANPSGTHFMDKMTL